MEIATVTSFDSTLKDLYPAPGTRLKQWVVDTYRESAWERETCPQFTPGEHEDNTGTECRNSFERVPWTYLAHDCCYFCNDLGERYEQTPEVQAWLAERAQRPPICADRSKYSDQIAPDLSLARHPFLTMLPRR